MSLNNPINSGRLSSGIISIIFNIATDFKSFTTAAANCLSVRLTLAVFSFLITSQPFLLLRFIFPIVYFVFMKRKDRKSKESECSMVLLIVWNDRYFL